MKRDDQHDPDPNVNAARIVAESTRSDDLAPVGLEPAWAEWSKRIQKTDSRTMALLRAAFESGFEAGQRS